MTETATILWSASARGFYLAGVSSSIPDDAVAVDPALHAACAARLAQGATLSCCPETGGPIATAPIVSPADRRAGLVRAIKAEARRRIEAISPTWRQLNDLRERGDGSAARFAAIDAIRASSNAIEELLAAAADDALVDFPVTANPLWPHFGDA